MSAIKHAPVDSGKTQVQLDLSPASIERLNWLMVVCDLSTRKDLFNAALEMLDWAVAEMVDGKTVTSCDRTNKHLTQFSMPALGAAARFGEKERRQAEKEGSRVAASRTHVLA